MNVVDSKRFILIIALLVLTALVGGIVTATELDITGVTPANGAFIGKSVLFQIKNTTNVENFNLTIYHVEYYLGTALTLFANVSNTTVDILSAHQLINYNTTNSTFVFADALNTQITVRVYYMNLTRSTTALTVQNHTFTTITIDNTKPGVGIEFRDKNVNIVESPFNFFFGDTVTIDCNPLDPTAGVGNVSILVQAPGAQTFSQIGTENDGVAFTDTEEIGEYNVLCKVFDRSTNTNNQTGIFNILKAPPSNVIGSGGTGGGLPSGFVSPVGKKKVVAGSINDAGTLASEGTSRLIQTGGAVALLVKGESHKFEVIDVTDEQVVLSITSRPVDVTIAAGDTEEVDLNDDGVNDVAVTFHKRFPAGGKYADITFALTESPAAPAVEEDIKEQPSAPTTQPDQTVSRGNAGLWITIVVIVLIVIIGYTMIKGKKR